MPAVMAAAVAVEPAEARLWIEVVAEDLPELDVVRDEEVLVLVVLKEDMMVVEQ